jgi:hypothetical protein
MQEPQAGENERMALDLLIRGFQVSRLLRLVADLGIADRVPAAGHRHLNDLAPNAKFRLRL